LVAELEKVDVRPLVVKGVVRLTVVVPVTDKMVVKLGVLEQTALLG